ncbi:MAG: 50S ribosomal protein L38e [Candidatus Thorarchaeota archaeon]
MPAEITKDQLEEIVKLTIEQGGEVRTKRSKDFVKVKFRTKKRLYTIKLPLKEAESLINDISSRINVVSFS